MANKGNEINLDDTIEIDDEIITVVNCGMRLNKVSGQA